jgi:hypothetical protein
VLSPVEIDRVRVCAENDTDSTARVRVALTSTRDREWPASVDSVRRDARPRTLGLAGVGYALGHDPVAVAVNFGPARHAGRAVHVPFRGGPGFPTGDGKGFRPGWVVVLGEEVARWVVDGLTRQAPSCLPGAAMGTITALASCAALSMARAIRVWAAVGW